MRQVGSVYLSNKEFIMNSSIIIVAHIRGAQSPVVYLRGDEIAARKLCRSLTMASNVTAVLVRFPVDGRIENVHRWCKTNNTWISTVEDAE